MKIYKNFKLSEMTEEELKQLEDINMQDEEDDNE